METELLAPLFFVVVSLMTGAVMKYVLRKTFFPYTVGLFCFGIVLGILGRTGILHEDHLLGAAIHSAGNIDPDLILYIFLPILIFDAAYELNIHIFRKTLLNASILAVPGVVIAILLTGALVMGIAAFLPGFEDWTWRYALMFGALISATDPVAVVALLKELGTSKRFSTLVDTESLLNDGTGIVLFMLFFSTHATLTSNSALLQQFLVVVAGGVLLGLVMARLAIWFIQQIKGDTLVQTSAVILSTYVTFFLAEKAFHVSGVISLVSFGLTLTYAGKPRLKPQVNKFMDEFWELAAYIANTLIFIMVGVVIAMRVDITWASLLACILIYIGINVIRLLIIFLFYPLLKHCGYGITLRECLILGWGGLRGALGLTLALMVSASLPIPEEIRKQVLFITAGIVTLTLTLNATTIRQLLAHLGLLSHPSARDIMDYDIKGHLRQNAENYLEKLQKKEALEGADWEQVKHYLPRLGEKPQAEAAAKDLFSTIRLRVLDKEKQLVQQLFNEGVISITSLRKIVYSIENLYDHDGDTRLSHRKNIFDCFKGPFYVRWFRGNASARAWVDVRFPDWVVDTYDLGRGFLIVQKESLRMLNDLLALENRTEEEITILKVLQIEVKENVDYVDKQLALISTDFPQSYRRALTQKAIRMLLCDQQRTLRKYSENGMMTPSDAEKMMEEIDQHRAHITSFKQRQWWKYLHKHDATSQKNV